MDRKKLVVPLAAMALVLSAGGGIVAAAHADTSTTATTLSSSDTERPERQKPVAVGEVTAIDGDTITLTDSQSGTTYTVLASDAQIRKHEAPTEGAQPTAPGLESTSISVSDIAVGDTLMVQGTANGSTITATSIDDGEMHGGFGGHGHEGVRGTVSAINGSTLTVTGQDGTSYTVDASDATASKMQTISVSDISVGDSVGVDGTVSGTSVTATHLMDGIPTAPGSGK